MISAHLLQQAKNLKAINDDLIYGWRSRRFDRHGARNAGALQQVRTRALVLRGQVIEELDKNRYDEEALKALAEALRLLGEVTNV